MRKKTIVESLLLFMIGVVLGSTDAWAKGRKPPPVEYPVAEQSLDELLRHSATSPEETPSRTNTAPTTESAAPAPTPSPPPAEALQEHPSPSPVPPARAVPPTAVETPKPLSSEVAVTTPVLPDHYTIWIWQENGDCLWRIAEKIYGDRDKWRLIYLANRDVIQDPNKVYPKQKLRIPPADWQPPQ